MPRISAGARRAYTAERRKHILIAAAKTFAAKGYERATIANIARAAGIAEGSIYNYFKNKQDLLVSLPRQMLEPTIESVSARLSMTGAVQPLPPAQMLAGVAQKMLATIRQNAPIFSALLSALPSMKQSAREKYMHQVVLYATGVLEKYFQEQIKQGVLRKGLKPRILARAFIGMFFPFILLREVLQVETDADWNYDQLIADLVPLFLSGVLAISPEGKSK